MRRGFFAALVAVTGVVLAACGAAPPEPREAAREESDLPAVAQIVCRDGKTRVDTPAVRPQPDGVHLVVQGESEGGLSLAIEHPGGGGSGFDVPGRSVVDLYPGRVQVSCYHTHEGDPAQVSGTTLQVVDEEGIWISPRLHCKRVSGIIDYELDARGVPGTPLDAGRSYAEETGLRGEVERAGYPEAETPLVRVVHEGRIVARISLVPDAYGGWLVSGYDRCSE